jgi:hypothetical protein
MPTLETITDLGDGLAVGIHRKKNPKTGEIGNPRWYSRHYFPGEAGSHYISLRLEATAGFDNFREAEKRARENHRLQRIKHETGAEQTSPLDIHHIQAKYLQHWYSQALINEQRRSDHEYAGFKGEPLNLIEVDHGRGHYSKSRYDALVRLLANITPFWDTLPTTTITDITNRQLDGFLPWARRHFDWSPNRILRHITQIRMIWHFAKDEGIVDLVPSPKRPRDDIKKRKRRCFTETEYKLLVDWAEKNYQKITVKEDGQYQERKDMAFQFLCFVQFCAWIGYRPPAGAVKKNLLRWDSYKIVNEGEENEQRYLTRYNEKGVDKYTATIGKEVWALFDALRELYKARQIEDTEFIFAHTFDNGERWEVGSPILNFKKTWARALQELELDTDSDERRHRLTPYSLRSYHITMRIRYGNVNIYDLAMSLGTSMRMVQDAYDDYSTEAKWDVLTAGQMADRDYALKTDPNGNFIL